MAVPSLSGPGPPCKKARGKQWSSSTTCRRVFCLSDGPAQIRAGNGRYDMDKENVRVPGPVQVESTGGYRLTTSNVTIDLKSRTLQSEETVEGRTNIGTFRGDKLRADMSARTLTLSGNAKLRIEQNGLRSR